MKKLSLIILIISLGSSVSYSQKIKEPLYLSFSGGFTAPAADKSFTDYFNLGPNLNAALSTRISKNYMIRGELSYLSFPGKNMSLGSYDFKIQNISLYTANTNLLFGQFTGLDLHYYGFIGAGILLIDDDTGIKTSLGLNIGAGLMLPLYEEKTFFTLETLYQQNFSAGFVKGYVPIKAGVTFKL